MDGKRKMYSRIEDNIDATLLAKWTADSSVTVCLLLLTKDNINAL